MNKIINMNFKKKIKKYLNKYLIRRNLMITKYFKDPMSQISTLPSVDQIIDVGVDKGTPDLWNAFPKADLLLVDPLEECKELVKNNYPEIIKNRKVLFEISALGANTGSININIDKFTSLTSILKRSDMNSNSKIDSTRNVAMKRLEDLKHRINQTQSYGIKIDTEGYELEVLKGGGEVLKNATWLILEVSVKNRFINSYKFEDIILFLNNINFNLECILKANSGKSGKINLMDMAFVRGK